MQIRSAGSAPGGPESRRPGSRAATVRGTLLVSLAVVTGSLLGVGGYTFRYAEGLSYFSAEPAACVNCHIMRSQYDGWQKASHHAAAVCIDCHLPHDFVPKYLAKAENGYRHSKEFTAQTFAEPIFIKPRGAEILQENCVRCHAPLVAELEPHGKGNSQRGIKCVHCHASVGHGESARLGGRLTERERGE
jgi:cytochrome c nitrite reductase small subunit